MLKTWLLDQFHRRFFDGWSFGGWSFGVWFFNLKLILAWGDWCRGSRLSCFPSFFGLVKLAAHVADAFEVEQRICHFLSFLAELFDFLRFHFGGCFLGGELSKLWLLIPSACTKYPRSSWGKIKMNF